MPNVTAAIEKMKEIKNIIEKSSTKANEGNQFVSLVFCLNRKYTIYVYRINSTFKPF